MSETTLAPCPFCGHDKPRIDGPDDERPEAPTIIVCPECGCSSDYEDTVSEARDAWNTRTPPPHSAGVVVTEQMVDAALDAMVPTKDGEGVSVWCYLVPGITVADNAKAIMRAALAAALGGK